MGVLRELDKNAVRTNSHEKVTWLFIPRTDGPAANVAGCAFSVKNTLISRQVVKSYSYATVLTTEEVYASLL